jgi:hypothetical protein
MNEIDRSHPYWHIRRMAERYAQIVDSFYFSYYKYIPQTLVDDRTVFKISLNELRDEELVFDLLYSVPAGYELAIHSLVALRDRNFTHIPMADMSSQSLSKLAKYRAYLDFSHEQQFAWYKSGRSFHGYGDEFIDMAEWPAYMGKLLLANEPGMPPVVDPRWVGHRLIGGYAALRWTKNTDHYKEIPKKTAR